MRKQNPAPSITIQVAPGRQKRLPQLIVNVSSLSATTDVFAFEKKPLQGNRTWEALGNETRPVGFNIPVFIPIDEVSRKNLGDDISNVKKLAIWSVHLTAEELTARDSSGEEIYVEQFRRRFAAKNGVDIGLVRISIEGKPK
jgi:hypothetical protein